MDRCKIAKEYHERGCNCAQSVLAAFGDLTHLSEGEALALAGGFGGGVGGCHEELCGAASGAVLVLGILSSRLGGDSQEIRRRTYAATKEFRKRFQDQFRFTRCGDLLSARIGSENGTNGVRRLGVSQHCAVLVVSAVEILEELLRESGTAAQGN